MPTYHSLTTVEKESALACLGARIRDYQHNNLLTAMLGLIGRAHLNCGFPLDQQRIDLTIDELVNDLKKYNGTLTILEIELAFKNGYKKEYGEFFGLNNATYFQWVNGYTWSDVRLKAKKAMENKPKTKPEPSEQEKERIVKEGALKMFEDHKKGSVILDPGNVTYNYLDKLKIIKFTAERKNHFIADAKEKMIHEAISNKGTKTIAKAIEDAIKSQDVIIANAKREALKEHFNQLKELGLGLFEEDG